MSLQSNLSFSAFISTVSRLILHLLPAGEAGPCPPLWVWVSRALLTPARDTPSCRAIPSIFGANQNCVWVKQVQPAAPGASHTSGCCARHGCPQALPGLAQGGRAKGGVGCPCPALEG